MEEIDQKTDLDIELQAESGKRLRILVVRPDRLGDVILSTPVFEVIKQHYSKAQLTCMVKDSIAPILKGLSCVDHVMDFDPEGRHAGIKGFIRLYKEIRCRQFRIAVVLQSHWKIAAVLFLAGIRYRVGPLSKIHSFFFYNRGVRQRRSQVEMHESDYNLQLLRRLGIRVATRTISTQVAIPKSTQDKAKEWLIAKGWTSKKTLVIVHPGMGGSALNWPESHYHELIRSLIESDKQVLVTGGLAETVLLGRVEEALGPLKERVIFFKNDQGNSIDFLGGLFQFADLVVAPSTGPLHLAVALKRPVVTFFPPIRVQSAIRWGPYLLDEAKASILVPENYCGQDFKCLGVLCNYFPCMKSLTVKETIKQVEKQLNLQKSKTDESTLS